MNEFLAQQYPQKWSHAFEKLPIILGPPKQGLDENEAIEMDLDQVKITASRHCIQTHLQYGTVLFCSLSGDISQSAQVITALTSEFGNPIVQTQIEDINFFVFPYKTNELPKSHTQELLGNQAIKKIAEKWGFKTEQDQRVVEEVLVLYGFELNSADRRTLINKIAERLSPIKRNILVDVIHAVAKEYEAKTIYCR